MPVVLARCLSVIYKTTKQAQTTECRNTCSYTQRYLPFHERFSFVSVSSAIPHIPLRVTCYVTRPQLRLFVSPVNIHFHKKCSLSVLEYAGCAVLSVVNRQNWQLLSYRSTEDRV